MATTANAFVANGPAAIGVEARPSFRPHWFKFGVLAVGHTAGVIGATNDVTSAIPPAVNMSAGVWGVAKFDYGVIGESLGTGVKGEGDAGPGVDGFSNQNSGIRGIGGLPPSAAPPAGFDLRAGVSGQSENYPGLVGFSTNREGLQGLSANRVGVLGVAGAQGPVPALVNIAGVVGSSDQQTGVIGTSNAWGVYGYCGNANPGKMGIGVYGRVEQRTPNNYAGLFDGNVQVNGDLLLLGTANANVKNAIVPFPDGTHRLLHCMESPEHWFEDFGAAKLKRGRAVVKLDANFAKVIKRGDYKVFLTPEGDCRGLYVRKSAGSFEVRECGAARRALRFRIVSSAGARTSEHTGALPRSTSRCRSFPDGAGRPAGNCSPEPATKPARRCRAGAASAREARFLYSHVVEGLQENAVALVDDAMAKALQRRTADLG